MDDFYSWMNGMNHFEAVEPSKFNMMKKRLYSVSW